LLYRQAGRAQSAMNQPAEAIASFMKALDFNPRDTVTRFFLAQELIRTQQMHAAERELQTILRIDPKNESALAILAKMYLAAGNIEDAKQVLEIWLEISPDNKAARMTMLDLLLAEKKTEQARELLIELLKEMPEDLSLGLKQVELDLEEDKFQSAEKHITDLMEKHPDNMQLKILLVRIYLKQKQWEEVVGLLQELHESQPEDTQIAIQLAHALWVSGSGARAIEKLEQVEKANSSPDVRRWLIMLLRMEARYSKAAEYLETWLDTEENPDDRLRWMQMMVQVYLLQDQTADAVKMLESSLKTDDPAIREEADLLLWNVLLNARRFEQALKHIDKALKEDPENLQWQIRRCKTLLAAEKFAEAAEQIEELLKKRKNPVIMGSDFFSQEQLWFDLFSAHFRPGRYEEAEEVIQRWLKAEPHSKMLARAVFRLYLAKEEPLKAVGIIKTIAEPLANRSDLDLLIASALF
jgi:predicted Zn-dependent protease